MGVVVDRECKVQANPMVSLLVILRKAASTTRVKSEDHKQTGDVESWTCSLDLTREYSGVLLRSS